MRYFAEYLRRVLAAFGISGLACGELHLHGFTIRRGFGNIFISRLRLTEYVRSRLETNTTDV